MADYSLGFETGTGIGNLYQALKNKGVSDAELDQGYPIMDNAKNTRWLINKDNRFIEKEEVLNYALENSQIFQLAIKQSLGYEIPWALDDLNPVTSFDEKIRTRVTRTIKSFKEILGKAGFQAGTDRYNELLALALYAWVMTPEPEKAFSCSPNKAQLPEDAQDELTGAGLNKIVDYIGRKGGLGLINIREKCKTEATALEALSGGCGTCSEQSSILFAVFQMAGLSSMFVVGQPRYQVLLTGNQREGLHVAVVLKLAGVKSR